MDVVLGSPAALDADAAKLLEVGPVFRDQVIGSWRHTTPGLFDGFAEGW